MSRDRSLQEPGRPQRSLASHCQILQMVEMGDVIGAQQAMDHHLTAVEPSTRDSHQVSISAEPEELSTRDGHQVSLPGEPVSVPADD